MCPNTFDVHADLIRESIDYSAERVLFLVANLVLTALLVRVVSS